MGGDEGGADVGDTDGTEPQPAKRRATFVPPVRLDEDRVTGPADSRSPQGDRDEDAPADDTHDDDELAGALEHEVTLLTASLPIIRPESLFTPARPSAPPYAPLTEAEREIAAEAASGHTLEAIEHLEALIAGRPPTAAPGPPEASAEAERDDEIGESELDADVSDDADDIESAGPELLPIATPRVRPREGVLSAGVPQHMPVFAIEQSGTEPTQREYRAVRAGRLFWLWFAACSSVLVMGLGAVMVAAGLNVVQVVIAALLGIALSFVPLGLGSLTGVWSGQPTVIVSRATFGVVGNTVPAALILVVRVFWAAALLWLLSVTVADSAVAAEWTDDRGLAQWTAFGVAAVVSVVIAFVGYALVAVLQAVATIVTSALAVAVIVVAWPKNGWDRIGSAPYGEWILVVQGAVLVFSILGLAWASTGGDLARYQRPGAGGTATALWGGFGASLPMLILVVFGAVAALASPTGTSAFRADPVVLLTTGTPHWFAVPVIAAIAVGLVPALVVSIYSGGFAVQAVGVHLPRWASVLVLGALAVAGGAGLVVAVPDIRALLLAYPTTLAVPIAAWAGIFVGDFLLRGRRLATDSLIRRGGVYPDWRWANVAGLVLISVVGLGFMRADAPWLRWEGYLYRLVGVDAKGTLAGSDLGVLLALVLGLAVGVAAGWRAVPAQESASR